MTRTLPIPRRLAILGALLTTLAFAGADAPGRVEVSLDAAAVSDLLAAAVPPSLGVALPGGLSATLRFEEVRVVGFEPGAGRDGGGLVHTWARVSIPELGWSATVEPRIAVSAEKSGEGRRCRLRFEQLEVPLPLVGTRDIGPWLPPLGFPAEQVSSFHTARGDYEIETQLADIALGTRALRLGFEVRIRPRGRAAGGASQ